MLDDIDRKIINALQGGFPISERPFADAARTLDLTEGELIERIRRLLDEGTLSRFGPMYNADRMGGSFCLCAMTVPADELDAVAERVNAFPEVAHNYERVHALNMWFVLATETPERIDEVVHEIERANGYPVYAFPKCQEFFVGLRVTA